MKKIILVFIIFIMSNSVMAQNKYTEEYLVNHSHFSPGKSIVELLVENNIKSTLKKETNANFKVKFVGYNLSSMKKGIFKSLELSGNNVNSGGILIPYVHLATLTDYNYIDYKSEPIKFKSDMQYAYDLILDENTINSALQMDEYKKITNKVNKLTYPLFMISAVKTKIINNRLYLIISYNFPIKKASKDRAFITSTDLKIVNGKIIATDVHLDSAYGSLPLDRVANLINLLNPLEFTVDLLDSKQCDANIENVNFVDNKIKVDGKIFIKGE